MCHARHNLGTEWSPLLSRLTWIHSQSNEMSHFKISLFVAEVLLFTWFVFIIDSTLNPRVAHYVNAVEGFVFFVSPADRVMVIHHSCVTSSTVELIAIPLIFLTSFRKKYIRSFGSGVVLWFQWSHGATANYSSDIGQEPQRLTTIGKYIEQCVDTML